MKKTSICLSIFVFFVTTVPPFKSALPQTAEVETAAPLSLENLAIDETIGKVEERFAGRSDRAIVQIQDVHAHYTAQENIAAILEHLSSVCGIKKVALEGAWTATDLPKSRAIPTSREKQLLARSLMEKDLISGPAYAALLSPSPLTLLGIEDPVLYEKNRQLFLNHLSKAGAIEVKLKACGDQLQASQKTSWNPELLAFGEAFGKFRETSDFGKFFPVLIRTANGRSIDFSDLDQVVLVRDIMALEKEFTKARLEAEVKKLLREYKDTSWNLEELIRGGKIPQEKIGFYPELAKLARLFKMRDRVSLQDLMAQIETLTGRVLWTLVKTKKEEALWDKSERFYLAKRILLLEATPSDLTALEKEKAALETELQEAGLEEELDLSLSFYDVVKERDKVFYEKLVNDPVFSGPVAIVTGGFHTAGLSARLREAGISYITITPDLGDGRMNEELYQKRMEDGGWQMTESKKTSAIPAYRPGRHPSPSDSSTLSELQNSIEWTDERFAEAYKILLATKDVRKAVAAFSGVTVSVLPSEKIPALAAKGPLRPSTGKGAVMGPELREGEFMKKPRPEQLQRVRDWLAETRETRVNAMLVSSVSVMNKMLSRKDVPRLVEQIAQAGDILALLEDVPAEKVPELFWERGVERFKAPDLNSLIQKTPHFQRLAKRHPFAVMKNGYQNDAYVVLPEHPASLVLYRIVTLNPGLYQAARNPEFLALLQGLVTEILSQELTGEAA